MNEKIENTLHEKFEVANFPMVEANEEVILFLYDYQPRHGALDGPPGLA